MKTTYRMLSAGIFACASSLVLTASTEPGILWDTKNFERDRADFIDIASDGGSRLIAVGRGGSVLYSDLAAPDETDDWTVSSYPDTTEPLNDITTGEVAGSPRTVVVGTYGTVLSSDDEFYTTTPQTSGVTSPTSSMSLPPWSPMDGRKSCAACPASSAGTDRSKS